MWEDLVKRNGPKYTYLGCYLSRTNPRIELIGDTPHNYVDFCRPLYINTFSMFAHIFLVLYSWKNRVEV